MNKSGWQYAVACGIATLVGCAGLGFLLQALGMSERSGLLIGAAVTSTLAAALVYDTGVSEGKSNASH